MDWSADLYSRFEDERTRPVRDLLGAVPAGDVRHAVDLGCGPGNSTAMLADRYPLARIEGLDSSADMVAAARRRLPRHRFVVGTIEAWSAPGPFDLILSNAALHWVSDHAVLLPRLVDRLVPGGSLAVQMPDNLAEPSHRAMARIAASGPWAGKLAGAAAAARTAVEAPGWYFGLLAQRCARVDVWRTVHHHPLAGGADAVVEWFAGSGLRPYLDPLGGEEREAFVDCYRAEIARAYPPLSDGSVLLAFPRLFLVATR